MNSTPEDDAREEVEAFLADLEQAKPASKSDPVPQEDGSELNVGGELLMDMMDEERFAQLTPETRAAVLKDVQADLHEVSLASVLALVSLQLVEIGLNRINPDHIDPRAKALFMLASEISARAYQFTQSTRLLQIKVEDLPALPDNITDDQFKELIHMLVKHVNETMASKPEDMPVSEDGAHEL